MMAMHSLAWTDKFVTGIDFIDQSHQDLIDFISMNFSQQPRIVSRKHLEGRLVRLVDHLVGPIVTEENFLISIGYPEFDQHRSQHNWLIHEIGKIILAFESQDDRISDLVQDLLTYWFVTHVAEEDTRIGAHVSRPLDAGPSAVGARSRTAAGARRPHVPIKPAPPGPRLDFIPAASSPARDAP